MLLRVRGDNAKSTTRWIFEACMPGGQGETAEVSWLVSGDGFYVVEDFASESESWLRAGAL